MKRLIIGLLVAFVSIITLNANVGALELGSTMRDFTADYYLDINESGNSTLKTIEKVIADFPEDSTKHGIYRTLYTKYDGHTTRLKILSITDENNKPISYEEESRGDSVEIKIGEANKYARGLMTYIITYTQENVTKYFDNVDDDEFYWDVNGTEWQKTFDKVTANIHMSAYLVSKLNNKMSCYYGVSGSKDRCSIDNTDNVISATEYGLGANETMTIAIGFYPHTFTEYKMNFVEVVKSYLGIFFVFIGVIALVYSLIFRITKGKNEPGRLTIIAEYLPPKNINIATASCVFGKKSSWIAATYIDLAVRHKIKITEVDKKWSRKNNYQFDLINVDSLSDYDIKVIKALFGSDYKVGSVHLIKAGEVNRSLAQSLMSIMQVSYGEFNANYRKKLSTGYQTLAILLLAILEIIIMFTIKQSEVLYFGPTAVASLSLFVIAILITGFARPLNKEGAELRDYLKGLKLYISVAEEERLRMLQSPEGAEKVATELGDGSRGNLIKLYEKVLPYAVLFGQAKRWSDVLGKYYETDGNSPDWYAGDGVFSAAMFASSMGDLSSTSTSNSNYSSDSGGSDGGGSSGDGGGGGGGGDW